MQFSKQGIGDPREGALSARTSHLLGAWLSAQVGRRGWTSTPAVRVRQPLGLGGMGDIVFTWPLSPRRGVGAVFRGRGSQPGASGQASLCPQKGSHPCLGLGRPPEVVAGDFAYFVNIASLLSILELPRFPETGQPKGTSPLTCDVKYCDFRRAAPRGVGRGP